jgi:hypothetical protein
MTKSSLRSLLSVEGQLDNDFHLADDSPFALVSTSSSSERMNVSKSEARPDEVTRLESASEQAVSTLLEIADIGEVHIHLASCPCKYYGKIMQCDVYSLFTIILLWLLEGNQLICKGRCHRDHRCIS